MKMVENELKCASSGDRNQRNKWKDEKSRAVSDATEYCQLP